MSEEITIKDGRYVGPWRRPRNLHNANPGSIHDDATAQKLGFRGGTVAGNIHFEMMVPLLLKAFGPRWFERGTLSIDFKYAAQDNEEVRGIIDVPPEGGRDAQVGVLLEHSNGQVVGVGTASVGDLNDKTFLGAKDLYQYDMGEYEILRDVRPGDVMVEEETRSPLRASEARQAVNTEPMDWYVAKSPWGGPILTPTRMVGALVAYNRLLADRKVRGVGLYGAIEVRNVNGPVFSDETYRRSGVVVARGQSPKTEYFWFESRLDDASGKRVAEMLMQLRFMKGSQDLTRTRTVAPAQE